MPEVNLASRSIWYQILTFNPIISTHSIVIADPSNDVHLCNIPLQVEGVMSYFEYFLSTSAEFDDETLLHLELIALSLAWDPYDEYLLLRRRATSTSGTFDLCRKE